MTFNPAPWAVDGALTSSSLAREQTNIATGGAEGISRDGDLKVGPLAVPGNGITIAAGGALVLNRYQSVPTETYVVSNPDTHIVTASEMPQTLPTAQDYIVAVAVGDPSGNQNGHPFMTASDPPDGTEATFKYVRPVIVPVATGQGLTSIPGANYPYIALARLEVPSGTATITAAMIKPVAKIAQPKTSTVLGTGSATAANPLNGGGGVAGTYENWPVGGLMTVAIPAWATKAKIVGFVEGVRLTKVGAAKLRIKIGSKSTVTTNLNETSAQAVGDRKTYNVGGEIDVVSLRGTNQSITFEATPVATADKGAFTTDINTSGLIQVIFEEVSSA